MSAEGGCQAADVWIFPDGSVRAIPVEVLRYQLAAALKEEEEIHSIFLLDRETWVVDSTTPGRWRSSSWTDGWLPLTSTLESASPSALSDTGRCACMLRA